MEQSSFKTQLRFRQEFDSCCKAVIRNEMIDYERARKNRLKREKTFSDLSEGEWNRLYTVDEYTAESEVFRVMDYDIEVRDELIGEALKCLPEKKRNVILLSFFMEMTDTEIARHMKLVRSTIHHHRVSSLRALKQIMEEIKREES